MPKFTRSKDLRESKKTRKKRLSKNRFHRIFGRINIFNVLKNVFKGRIILIAACVGMLGFILFALFSPYFSLKQFEVKTIDTSITEGEIKNTLTDFIGENLFLLNKADVIGVLERKFPEIKEVSVENIWPDSVDISFQVSPAIFTINNESTVNNSTLSEDGVILSLSATEGLPIIKLQQHERTIKLRDKLIEKESLKKILLAEKLLAERLQIFPEDRIYLYEAQEIHFVTKRKQAIIWIDLTQEIEDQIEKLVLAEKRILFQSRNFKHIDLRIPRQIFWEWK